MKIGNRLFPYPILNNSNVLFSSYSSNCKFELQYGIDEQKNSVILADTFCVIENDLLRSLVESGKASVYLYVECPGTLFRRTYKIGLTPKNIEISYYDINDAVSLAAFIIANEDISNVTSKDFLSEYKEDNLQFTIEKNDILAVDEGYVHTVDFDSEDIPRKENIFIISINKDSEDSSVKYKWNGEKITILMPQEAFNIYKETGKIYKDIYMSLFCVPALVSALYDIKSKNPNFDENTIENYKIQYKWFRIFCNTYERINNKPFSDDAYDDLNCEIQKIFDYLPAKSVGEINYFTFKEEIRDED